MAVYTTLSLAQVNELIRGYDLPEVSSLIGAGSGIENTTYFITLSSKQELVLTLFELLPASTLPFYALLTTTLHDAGLPVPAPLHDKAGASLHSLAGKPALLFPKASGQHVEKPDREQCARLGQFLGRMHQAAQAIPDPPAAAIGFHWMTTTAQALWADLPPDHQRLLEQQLELAAAIEKIALPSGIVHGDLFRDNVLFDGNIISAVIDFYGAGCDRLLFDLAIAANDWCFIETLSGKQMARAEENASAMIEAYQQERPLTAFERDCWPTCLQVAAARLWLSRLARTAMANRGVQRHLKDPEEYRRLLLQHQRCSNTR